jgi:poly-D-alanine transfer protein DltD
MRKATCYSVCIFFVLLASNIQLTAQQNDQGYLRIVQDPRIDSLMQLNRQINSTLSESPEGFLDGFRIQIFMESGNDAVERAQFIIEGFNEDYPILQAYLTYRQPYYRIRVGNFRTRLEAEGYLRQLSRKYNQAFVIKDKIHMPQLQYIIHQNQEP